MSERPSALCFVDAGDHPVVDRPILRPTIRGSQVNIVELVRVPASQRHERIGKVRDVEVLRLRGELLPMVYLEKVLRIPELRRKTSLWESTGDGNSDRRPLNVLVVETGEIRYGLVVDELRDSQEIVVKPLGRHIKDCKALDAATILGDGHIAWILSIAGIATLSQLSQCPITHGEMDRKDSSSDGLHDRQHFVLFTNQAGEWFCVPMDVVLRVDRITPEQIVRVGNQETIEQHDTSLPLLRVESSISAQACPDPKRLTVIVFKYSGREIGLVAHNIHDIRTVSAAIDTVTCVESASWDHSSPRITPFACWMCIRSLAINIQNGLKLQNRQPIYRPIFSWSKIPASSGNS